MHCEKEQDVAGEERGHMEVGQHFSGKNVLLLAPADMYNAVQCWHWKERKKLAWTVREDQNH